MTTSRQQQSSSNDAFAAAQSYMNMASTMAQSPQAMEAGMVVQQNAREIQTDIRQGDWSLHVLSLLAGILMIVASMNGFLHKFVTLQWGSALLDVFVFLVGVGVILVESGVVRLSLFASTNTMIDQNAPYLKTLMGRGVLFVLTGIVQIYQRGLFDILIGCFVVYVGLTYLYRGRCANQKLYCARKAAISSSSFGLEQLQEHFAIADMDGKGALTFEQFYQFANNLGLALTKQEAEAAFLQIDNSHSGRLSYEDIKMWWTQGQPWPESS